MIAVALLLVIGYYVHEVREARQDTRGLVAAAIERHGSDLGLQNLSPEREAVLLAVEDPAFRDHRGVDLITPGAGMTTLTQSLVKQLYFPDGFRQGVPKIRQTLIAQHALDALIPKDEQLGLFLNIAYFGHEGNRAIHGFSDAAKTYFGKEFEDLSDDEFLALVAMLINPNALKPHTDANRGRVERIRRYIAGEYRPLGVMDVEYRGVEPDLSLSARGLMVLLRLIIGSRPK